MTLTQLSRGVAEGRFLPFLADWVHAEGKARAVLRRSPAKGAFLQPRTRICSWHEQLSWIRTVEGPTMSKSSPLGSPRTLLALIVAVAIVVAALLAILSQLGGSSGGGSSEDVGKLYSGIPQNGTTLGKNSAPVTIYLYEDFQCPICGQFSRETFPEVVDRSVRGGEVKVVSEPLTFIGPDSVLAARAALAAGEQNRYWPYASLLFENQQQENSGYVTDEFLNGLAQDTPGLDTDQWSADLKGSAFTQELEAAQAKAQSSGVDSTPTLVIIDPGGQSELVGLHTYSEISEAIDQVDGS
jgi:protein-disulfide isomerase